MALTQIGNLAATSAKFRLNVIGAAVTIRREDRADIAFLANNPKNWAVSGSGIEQTHAEESANSINISISGNGNFGNIVGSVISGGRVSNCRINGRLINIDSDGVFVDGKKQKDDPAGGKIGVLTRLMAKNSSTMQAGGRKLEILDSDVYVDGKKQVDDNGDETGTAAEAAPKPQPDQLEVVVPLSYRGGIDVTNEGNDTISFTDAWTGGDVVIEASSTGDVDANAAFVGVGRFTVKQSSVGDVNLKDVTCREGSLTISGTGDLEAGAINAADSFELDQSSVGGANVRSLMTGKLAVDIDGSGDLQLPAIKCIVLRLNQTSVGGADLGTVTCREFVAKVTGTGDLVMDRLDTDTFDLTQNSMGGTTISAGSAKSGSVTNSGMGDVELTGKFGSLRQRNTGMGDIEIDD